MSKTTENTEHKAQWKKTVGFAEDTERVTFTVHEDLLETWDEEVTDQGFSNRSDYLRALIAEARAYRASDIGDPHSADRRIQELQSEVERLEQQLDHEKRAGSGRISIDDPRFLDFGEVVNDEKDPLLTLPRDVTASYFKR